MNNIKDKLLSEIKVHYKNYLQSKLAIEANPYDNNDYALAVQAVKGMFLGLLRAYKMMFGDKDIEKMFDEIRQEDLKPLVMPIKRKSFATVEREIENMVKKGRTISFVEGYLNAMYNNRIIQKWKDYEKLLVEVVNELFDIY